MAEARPVTPAPPVVKGPASSEASLPPGSTPLGAALACPTCGGRYPADFKVCPHDATPLESAPASEEEDTLIGQQLGGTYEILRVIGEGGMGRVYEARHVRIAGKRFALKLLHPDLARQPDVVARFQREAQAASTLSHPNVVGVYDVNTAPDGRPFLVAELLEGEPLGEYLSKLKKLPLGEAVRIARQVSRALGAAHDHGIVHRDIKPENVFLVDGGSLVKVIDFGISKVGHGNDNLTKTGTVMGTPDYMAPEQARGDKVDSRADIYAVGAILYRSLTGRKPFTAPDPMSTLTAVLTQEPTRPSTLEVSIPLPLELVIQRAMAKRPEERYPNMRELDRALSQFDPGSGSLPDGVTEVVLDEPNSVAAAQSGSHEIAAESARSVRMARPGLVFYTLLGGAWLVGNLVAAIASLLRLGGKEPTSTEAIMALAGAGAFVITPSVLWFRHVVREIWPSTPRAMQAVSRLKRTVLFSATAYGLCALAVVLFETVVEHTSADIARPMWWLGVFNVAMVVGFVTWLLGRPRRSQADVPGR